MSSIFARLAIAAVLSSGLIACSSGDKAASETSTVDVNASPEQIKAQTLASLSEMSPSELMDKATQESNALADMLAAVSDEASARQAAKELRAFGPRVEAMGERLSNLGEDEISFSLKSLKEMRKFGEAQMRVAAETARIARDHPELRDIFSEEFDDIEIKINR